MSCLMHPGLAHACVILICSAEGASAISYSSPALLCVRAPSGISGGVGSTIHNGGSLNNGEARSRIIGVRLLVTAATPSTPERVNLQLSVPIKQLDTRQASHWSSVSTAWHGTYGTEASDADTRFVAHQPSVSGKLPCIFSVRAWCQYVHLDYDYSDAHFARSCLLD
jgi:hypothetical protein